MTPLPSGWCYSHDPALTEQRNAARVLGGAIGDALRLDNSAQRAQVVAALASVALTALERAARHPPEDGGEAHAELLREMLERCGLVGGAAQAQEGPSELL